MAELLQLKTMADAEKLAPFVSDLLRVGSVKGFKFFRFYLRGREELLITVMNQPRNITPLPSPASSFGERYLKEHLPRNQDSLMISGRTQRRLSGYGYINVGLPPASPSDREITPHDELSTTFLIAAYARYNCPYVWVRTNHERLIRLESQQHSNSQKDADADAKAKDSPLKLKTTSAWANKVVKVWDVIAEIVEVCCQPSPANPLAVDHSYFASLEGLDKILESSAMVYFLQRVLDSGSHPFDDKVANDLRLLGQMHFEAVHDVMGSDTASSSSSSSGGGAAAAAGRANTQKKRPNQTWDA